METMGRCDNFVVILQLSTKGDGKQGKRCVFNVPDREILPKAVIVSREVAGALFQFASGKRETPALSQSLVLVPSTRRVALPAS
jgi:hypothetical protein